MPSHHRQGARPASWLLPTWRRAPAINSATEGVRLTLRDDCADEKGNSGNQFCRIKRFVTEEIEIQGLAVSKMQREGRPAIKHEFFRDRSQLVP